MVGLSVFLFWLLGLVVFLSLPPGLLSIMAQLAALPAPPENTSTRTLYFPPYLGDIAMGSAW